MPGGLHAPPGMYSWVRSALRAEESGPAPADRISVSVERDRPARPVAAPPANRCSYCVSRIGRIARLHDIGGTVRVCDRATHDGAGDDTSNDPCSDGTA